MSDRDDLILAALGQLEVGQAKIEASYKELREDQTALRVGLMSRLDR